MPKSLVASRKDPAVLVRFPKLVLKRLDLHAQRNGRSRNSELLHIVSEKLDATDGGAAAIGGR